jgi:two-component system response regulator
MKDNLLKELEKCRKKLEECEKRFRELWENVDEILYLLTPDGTFIDANRTALKIFGYAKRDLKKINIKDVVAEDYVDLALEKIREIIEKRQPLEAFELPCRTRSGEIIWVEIRVYPIIKNGKVIAIQGMARDITEKKRLEEEIRSSEEKYRDLFENSLEIMAITNLKGEFVEVNRAFEDATGFSREEVIGRSYREFVPDKETAEIIFRKYNEAFKSEKDLYGLEFEISTKRRDKIVLEGNIRLLKKGNIVWGFQGIFRDITDRKRLELELKRRNRILSIINEINGLLVHERDERVLLERISELLAHLEDGYSTEILRLENSYLTRAACSGYTPHPVRAAISEIPCAEMAVSKGVTSVMDMDLRREICPYYSIFRESRCFTMPMNVNGSTMGVVILHTGLGVVPDEEEIKLLETMAKDIAFALKSREIDVARKKALEQIQDNIEKFAILVDHLRNPLAAIEGYAEIFGDEASSKIKTQVRRIERVIRDLEKGWLHSEEIKEYLKKWER